MLIENPDLEPDVEDFRSQMEQDFGFPSNDEMQTHRIRVVFSPSLVYGYIDAGDTDTNMVDL